MLTPQQISEIREHLEKAQNPVFFFDNDPDGLCSFLLLQRWVGRGKGVSIRSFPELDKSYFRKVDELKADYVFVLDKNSVSEGFLEECLKINIPVVWIDHHVVPEEMKERLGKFDYYNPQYNTGKNKSGEAVTSLCSQVVNNEKDDWLSVVGSIFDRYFPEEAYKSFKEKYPELAIDSEDEWEIYYNSEIGKIARIFSFALKDRTTNIVRMTKFLMDVKSPNEVLEESNGNKTMHSRFKEINQKYQILLEKAKQEGSVLDNEDQVLFFRYSGDLSISSDLSDELVYSFKDKIVVVNFVTGNKVNVSVRGKNIKEKVLKIISEFEGATGGGHDNAVGAMIQVKDLEKFKEELERIF